MSSTTTDWYDLSDEDKSQVASQIYSPIFTGQLSSRPDLHEKIDVSVDHRSGRIDAKLADIIRWLWENGMETTGCCENSLGNRIDDLTPPGYPSFHWNTAQTASRNF